MDLAKNENVRKLLEEAENEKAEDREKVPPIRNEPDNESYEANIPHSTKGNKLPIITASAGLLLGLSIAYLAGAATLTPVGAAVAVFIASVVVGALIGYGFGKFCEKKVSEKKQKDPNMNTWGTAKSVLSGVFTTGHFRLELPANSNC